MAKKAKQAFSPLSKRIREDWGTVTHYCRKRGINPNTLKQVVYGFSFSTRILDILIADGYVKDRAEMDRLGRAS